MKQRKKGRLLLLLTAINPTVNADPPEYRRIAQIVKKAKQRAISFHLLSSRAFFRPPGLPHLYLPLDIVSHNKNFVNS
jgi:hypothetical protein